jgi:hypothetical protein
MIWSNNSVVASLITAWPEYTWRRASQGPRRARHNRRVEVPKLASIAVEFSIVNSTGYGLPRKTDNSDIRPTELRLGTVLQVPKRVT